MADISDVEISLVSAVARAVYPDGTGQPSVAGVDCRVYRGWPQPQRLEADLAAGKINVSVFPQDNERRTTRYASEWVALPVAAPALTLTASGTSITLSGAPSSPLNAAALVNGTPYVYPVQPGDTLSAIATGMATLINADTPASSSGPVITIPAVYRLAARVGAVGSVVRELRRQKRGFQVSCWCPSPGKRDAVAPAIDAALASVDFLALPDGSSGRLLYEKTRVFDGAQREGLYRRDLLYSVEYATTQSQSAAQIVAELLGLYDAAGNPIPPRGAFSELTWDQIDTPWDETGGVWSAKDKPIDQIDTKWEDTGGSWGSGGGIDEIATNWDETDGKWENKE